MPAESAGTSLMSILMLPNRNFSFDLNPEPTHALTNMLQHVELYGTACSRSGEDLVKEFLRTERVKEIIFSEEELIKSSTIIFIPMRN